MFFFLREGEVGTEHPSPKDTRASNRRSHLGTGAEVKSSPQPNQVPAQSLKPTEPTTYDAHFKTQKDRPNPGRRLFAFSLIGQKAGAQAEAGAGP